MQPDNKLIKEERRLSEYRSTGLKNSLPRKERESKLRLQLKKLPLKRLKGEQKFKPKSMPKDLQRFRQKEESELRLNLKQIDSPSKRLKDRLGSRPSLLLREKLKRKL